MKTYHSLLSTIQGLLLSKYESVRGIQKIKAETDFPGFTKVKTIKNQTEDNLTVVGVYKNKTGKRKLIKYVQFATKNRTYQQLYNEFDFLKQLSLVINKKSSRLHIPVPDKMLEEPNRLALVSEYCDGKPLTKISTKQKLAVMKEIITTLESLPTKTFQHFPKRSPFYIFLTFHMSLLQLLAKDISQLKTYLSHLATFYKNYLSASHGDLVVAHRDLHSGNVLYTKNKITLLDPEVMALCEKQTDLAILAKSYAPLFGSEFIEYVKSQLKTTQEKKRFISLSLYYAVQMMAISNPNDLSYSEAKNYLLLVLPTVKSTLIVHNSYIEHLHSTALRIIGLLTKSIYKAKIILCYHSISSDGWRFATTPEVFEKQMKYIAKYNPVSLTTLLSSDKPGISVTFDDGYEDFLTTALPVMKKYKIPATMFVLGDPEHANRDELQNNKNMLSISQVKQLKKDGVEIGFHTATHADMRNMNKKQLDREIKQSKEKLENTLGFKLTYFAYPRGLYSKRITDAVIRAGFSHALTVDGGSVSNTSSPYLINRISIEGTTTLEEFKTLLTPLGILFETTYMSILKLKEHVKHTVRKGGKN